MDVSVLIPQYGATDLTVRAIDSVHRSHGELAVEILVHDNGSLGGPGPVAERDDVLISTSVENLGFGPAVNRLARQAAGRYLLILNNDVILHPKALVRLVARADSLDAPGPVVPQYRDFEGKVLELGAGLGEGGRAWQLFHRLVPPAGLTTTPHRADFASAAAMLVPRDVFLDAGGFDDRYAPAYYEDTDLCLRLALAGRPTTVEPSALAFHYEGATAGRDTSSGLKAHQLRNRTTFVERWGEELAERGPVGLHRSVTAATTPEPGQPRVLWVGPTLPRRDRDGGGRRIVEMLTALRICGVGLAFFARSAQDPDRYGAHLASLGIPWFGGAAPTRWTGADRVLSVYDEFENLLRAAPWDVVVISFARLVPHYLDQVREVVPGAAVVVDNGDLHYLRHERAQELGIVITDKLTKEAELDAYAASDGVITSSRPEDRVLTRELDGLATHVFTVAPPMPVDLPPARDGGLMFLGNFGHPPNSDAVEYWVAEIAERVTRLVGSSRPLRVVGSGTDALPHDPSVDVVGWVPDLATEFRHTRVFVAPLRYGAGTKGKILEAMAHGIPVVTTANGAEGFPAEVVSALLIADEPDGFAAKVALMAVDDAAWERQRAVVKEAAAEFHKSHQRAGEALTAWLSGRALAVRHGTVQTPRRVAATAVKPSAVVEATPAVISDGGEPHDREFVAEPHGAVALCPDPIFVVGAPRSGTSMMAHALGEHPDLWVGEESDFLIPLAKKALEAWEFGRQRGNFQWLFAEGVSADEFLTYLGHGMNALYTQRSDGLRWVEQTPQYTMALEQMATMFPGARFVYMLRDGRSVVHSLRHFVRPVDHEPASELWRRFVTAGLGFKDSERGDRLHVVSYENVVTNTEEEVKALYEFLGLADPQGTIDFISKRAPINSSFEQDEPTSRGRSRWHGWSVREREIFHAAAGDLLIELGYERDSSWIQSRS